MGSRSSCTGSRPTVDENVTFADVNPLLVEPNLIDSILVPDTLNTGRIQTVLTGDGIAKVATPAGERGGPGHRDRHHRGSA